MSYESVFVIDTLWVGSYGQVKFGLGVWSNGNRVLWITGTRQVWQWIVYSVCCLLGLMVVRG
jgi:hypothetical protein